MRSVPIAMVSATARSAAVLGCWLLAAMLSQSLSQSLWAGEARLIGAPSPDRVVVEASDATVDEVLAVLGAQLHFSVERSGQAGQPLRLSGRFEGPLDEVLDRVLRHQGHMIVRSAGAHAGVSRVLLLDAKGQAAPSLAGPIAAIKAKMQAREQGAK